MRSIWRLARNDLLLTVRDRASLLWLALFPIALMWFFGEVAGGDRDAPPPRISLTVVDEDGGWLSRAFVDELRDETIGMREMTPEEARAAEDKVRTLWIPAGFTEGVLAGEEQALRFAADAGSNLEFGLAARVHLVRAIVRTLATLTEMAPAEDEDAATLREEFAALLEREALVTLEVDTAGAGVPVPRGFAQSVPGILTMTVLMMTVIYGAVFLTLERTNGMLRRQAMLPASRLQIVAGKLLGRFLVAGGQIAILALAGRFLFGISWGRSPAGLALLLAAYGFAVAGMATFLGALARTVEQASGIGWLSSMVLAGLGGCWWPAEVMPGWLRTAAHVLPTTWAMDGFHALISFGRGAWAVGPPAIVLLAFGGLFTALGARFLRFD
ncbi:MAG: ABC transporter permease [Acidobacteriota bacterium]